jgi:hypothetical protein
MSSESTLLSSPPKFSEENTISGLVYFLPILALCVDLITPFLISRGLLPASLRWISHAAVALMILGSIARMLAFNHFPRVVWLVPVISLVWAIIAIFNGQGAVSTIWGWWLFFQFPFVGLFMYLQPTSMSRFPDRLLKLTLGCLVLEVAVQCVQFVLGERPGDNLSGLFGYNGTGNLIIFIIFTDCLFLGHWIITKHWSGMATALLLSLISSILGEMKLFVIGLPLIFAMALVIYSIRHRTIIRSATYSLVTVAFFIAFVYLYNLIIPGASNTPLQTYINDPQQLVTYLNRTQSGYMNGYLYTDIGRNAALTIGWNSLQRDTLTMLFGWGIGTRSESISLGTEGIGLQLGDLGASSGTGLLIEMQEMGIVGLILITGFFLWIIFHLAADIHKDPASETTELRFAIVLFTVFWPLWLWYNNAWTLRVPMLLYWAALGYVLSEVNKFPIRQKMIQSFNNP